MTSFQINLTERNAGELSVLDLAEKDERLRRKIAEKGSAAVDVQINLEAKQDFGGRLVDPGRNLVQWCSFIGSKLTNMESLSIVTREACRAPSRLLYFTSDDGDYNVVDFPIQALLKLLQKRANTLQSLVIRPSLPLTGSKTRYEETFAQLAQMPKLKEFWFSFAQPMRISKRDKTAPIKWAADALVAALSQMPCLEKVTLREFSGSTTALLDLCHKPAGPGKKKKPLLSLDLLLSGSAVNDCSTLSRLCGPNARLNDLALSSNTNGSWLDMVVPVIQSLRWNTTLKDLTLLGCRAAQFGSIAADANRELLSVLQHNTSVTDVFIAFDDPYGARIIEWNEETAFWMKMNEKGRAKLNANPNDRQLWIDSLVANKGDHRIVFHLCSSNPHVFFGGDKVATARRQDRFPMIAGTKAGCGVTTARRQDKFPMIAGTKAGCGVTKAGPPAGVVDKEGEPEKKKQKLS